MRITHTFRRTSDAPHPRFQTEYVQRKLIGRRDAAASRRENARAHERKRERERERGSSVRVSHAQAVLCGQEQGVWQRLLRADSRRLRFCAFCLSRSGNAIHALWCGKRHTLVSLSLVSLQRSRTTARSPPPRASCWRCATSGTQDLFFENSVGFGEWVETGVSDFGHSFVVSPDTDDASSLELFPKSEWNWKRPVVTR